MRHYYLIRSGRLSRKNNTLLFELAGEEARNEEDSRPINPVSDDLSEQTEEDWSLLESLGKDGLGKFVLEDESENDAPVRITDRRAIPIEDVDALWAFRELDLNARVLTFLSQQKKPLHLFNYYGFYAGSFYPREYLQAGYVLTRQAKHFHSHLKRLKIAREFVESALFNIIRNLRYYANRGQDLAAETEGVQAEILRLAEVKSINELMACEGRARAAYYQAFEKIIKRRCRI